MDGDEPGRCGQFSDRLWTGHPRNCYSVRESTRLFVCLKLSGLALRPTQFPIRWVVQVVSLDVKQPGLKAGHSPPSSAEAENERIYTSVHMCSWPALYVSLLLLICKVKLNTSE